MPREVKSYIEDSANAKDRLSIACAHTNIFLSNGDGYLPTDDDHQIRCKKIDISIVIYSWKTLLCEVFHPFLKATFPAG